MDGMNRGGLAVVKWEPPGAVKLSFPSGKSKYTGRYLGYANLRESVARNATNRLGRMLYYEACPWC